MVNADLDISHISVLAIQLGNVLKERQLKLVAVESCTGGLFAGAMTAIAGSSDYFDCGLVTYSNASKISLVGVSAVTLQQCGAVSATTVAEMVNGGLRQSNGRAQVGVAITGIAGPDGGSLQKQVGTVYFAWKILNESPVIKCCHFDGDRNAIRLQSVCFAMDQLIVLLNALRYDGRRF